MEKVIKESIFWILMVVIIIGGSIWLLFYFSIFGTDGSDYKEVCIKGHKYYVANIYSKMSTAIVLDNEGRPINCKEELK